MPDQAIPEELKAMRQAIDQVDEQLVKLLAQRFQLTRTVGELKAAQGLTPVDGAREAAKLATIRGWCQTYALNPELATELFTRIMQEVVTNHRQLGELPEA